MRRLHALIGAALLSAFAAAPARATDPAAGTGGASFMKLGFGSTRALSMGHAYVAMAEGSEALTWNPGGLALTQQREVSYSYLRYVQDVSAPLYMAYAHPLGRTVLGANIAYVSVEGFDARDSAGVPIDNASVRARDAFATFSMARSFWYEKLFTGISLKIIHEDNNGTKHSNLVGDFGVILKPNNTVSFGFATQNFGSGETQVARVTRGGAAMKVLELLELSLELNKYSDNSARLGIGGEFTLPEDFLEVGQISVRAGYYGTDDQGVIQEKDRHMLYPLVGTQGLSFGLGLYSSQAFGYGVSFDYALVPFGALGTVDQLTLKVKF